MYPDSSIINLCIPSRNNPELLCATILSFDELCNHLHKIYYTVIYDIDDPKTGEALRHLKERNILRGTLQFFEVSEPFLSLGEYWTYAASKQKADYYMALGDDGFCMRTDWDAAICSVMHSLNVEVASWTDLSIMGLPGCYIVTDKWLKACGHFFCAHFPYWFPDRWLWELSGYVFNVNPPIISTLTLYIRQAATQNLRDLDFWWGFFNATRFLRLQHAREIAQALGHQFNHPREHLTQEYIARDLYFRGDRIADMEKAKGERKPPTNRYLKSLENAKNFLADHNLKPWQYTKIPGH